MFRFLIIYLSLFFFLTIGCTNSEKHVEEEKLKSNLVQSYIEDAKDEKKIIKDRRDLLDKAYGIYSTLQDNSFKVQKIHEISFVYYSLADYESYRNMNEKALKLSIKINDSINIAKSYGYLGIYYRPIKSDAAYENFYEADKIYSKLKGDELDVKKIAYDHGKVLIDIAKILQKSKNYSESERATISAIEKFNLSEDYRYLSICYTNLGTLAKYMDRYDEALEYQLKAIEFDEGTEREILQRTISYNNIGTVYKSQNKYDKAKEYYNKALSYKSFLANNPRRYARLLDNLGYVNFLSNDTANIPDLFYKALKIRDSINDKGGAIANYLHLAEYYKSIGDDSLAIENAEKSGNIASELKQHEDLLKSYDMLSELSFNSNDALKYARAHIRLNDSIQNQERMSRDKFARIRFETDQITQKNLQISRENEILIIAILGLTALFLLGYIIFRQQQSNKELMFAQTQQEANQEIYRLLLNQQIKLEEGRQLEQQRMSEELHDGVLGRLFGVRLSLDGINQRANDGFTEARNKYIEELKSIEKEIRLISHDLGTESLPSDVAYIDAVESLISDLCDVNEINFEFSNDENIDWEHIDDQKKVNLFRILQESLQNIFKHADAKSIKINFDFIEDKINLTILDDGIGFKSTKVKKGIGLKNITSRVSQMSGVVQFLSNKDSGTVVSVSVPT